MSLRDRLNQHRDLLTPPPPPATPAVLPAAPSADTLAEALSSTGTGLFNSTAQRFGKLSGEPAHDVLVSTPVPASSSPPPPVFVPQPKSILDRPGLTAATHAKSEQFEQLKTTLHSRLIASLKIDTQDEISKDDLRAATRQMLQHMIDTERLPVSQLEQDLLVQELVEDILGCGPLEPLMRDPSVSDILVNGPFSIFVERGGKLQKTPVRFRDNAHLMHVIDRIVSAVGRRVDEKTPMVDARMKDGSRFNAIIPPLALDGASLSIRKFRQDVGTLDKLVQWGSITPAMAQVLELAVRCHLNIVISGGTGSGKTTLLNSLSTLIEGDERIVTIEDSAELQLQQEHVVRLETRAANIEGEGAVPARSLLVNSLRMRPDRIIVGECRAGEALDMLQAMNTGHDGSMTTLHANTPRDAISRIETMCMMNANPLPEKTIRQQIASAVHLIVQASRLQDGSRKVVSISEVVGMEESTITLQEIYVFDQSGISPEGKVVGAHKPTGVRPYFIQKAASLGLAVPLNLFDTPGSATAKVSSSAAGQGLGGLAPSSSVPHHQSSTNQGGHSAFGSRSHG
jgi:pilus assembly protein CpaF